MRNLENKYPNKLKEFRLKKNLTQKQAADQLNLEIGGRLTRWEKGQSIPSITNLMKLAHLYAVPIEEIYENL